MTAAVDTRTAVRGPTAAVVSLMTFAYWICASQSSCERNGERNTVLQKNTDMDVQVQSPSDSDAFPDGRCRLILIGKTGCGKSATGNTILAREQFKSRIGINSETEICDVGSVKRNDLLITVMDTPGLADSRGRDDAIAMLITRSLLAVHPGPHAVILCIRCDDRFTQIEYKVFQALKEIFGAKMASYLIVLFVGADGFERSGVRFEEQLEKSDNLKSLLSEADNRYILFNNHADKAVKEQQVNQLLLAVKKVAVQNGGQCFRHKASPEISLAMAHLVDVEMKQEAQNGEQEKEKDLEGQRQTGIVKERVKLFSGGLPETDKTAKPAPPRAVVSPYTVPDREGMTFAEKQILVDRVLLKLMRHPEELSPAQQDELLKTSKSIGQKIKEGLSKFAVKAIDKCLLM